MECIIEDSIPEPVISQSLSRYLCNIKEKITDREKQWDIYKKYTNPYEYIHTIIPFKKKSVSQYKPISRSYFKMIEMLHLFSVDFTQSVSPPPGISNTQRRNSSPVPSAKINTFHLAEGPGGFIEAIIEYRNCKEDTYIGMTLLNDDADPNIPGWKKSNDFLKKNTNVFLENGRDGTGNILNIDNFEHCVQKYGSSMDFITGDGGFDFSVDFNQQEIHITQLLFAQIAYAICMQSLNGTFILKIFDAFMSHTLDLLYILSSFYEKTYIVKPQTSRYGNSEKYIVCKGFLFQSNSKFYSYFYKVFEDMLQNPDEKTYISRFINVPISYYFLKKMEEYNAIFGQKQIQNIHYTMCLIENKNKSDKLDQLMKINIQKCIDWCVKHRIQRNTISNVGNIFLHNENTESSHSSKYTSSDSLSDLLFYS